MATMQNVSYGTNSEPKGSYVFVPETGTAYIYCTGDRLLILWNMVLHYIHGAIYCTFNKDLYIQSGWAFQYSGLFLVRS